MATGLATRCPACGTVFRVVPDQLRVSEGWVRCGRCSEVFNATQSLVDLDTAVARKAPQAPPSPAASPAASPSASSPASLPPAPPPAEPPAPAQAPAEPPASAPAPMGEAEPVETEPGASRPAEFGALDTAPPGSDAAPAAEATMPDLDFGDGRREPAFDEASSPATAAAETTAAAAVDLPPGGPLEPSAGPGADEPGPPPPVEPPDDIVLPATAASAADDASADAATPAAAAKPEFLRRAERAERWRRPWVRALLVLGVLLGLGGLAGQVLHEYRDLAAARYPQLRPLLEQGCAWLDCRVGAARAIDSLAVESSGLVRVEGSELYRLNVVLRNRAGIPLALPALDLALTDRQGRLIARRVLRPGELGAAGETLDAGAEATLAGTLRAAGGPVAGYTVELFYP